MTLTLAQYNNYPKAYRDVWTSERYDLPNWEKIRLQYIGKRTLLVNENNKTVLLVEGMGLEII